MLVISPLLCCLSLSGPIIAVDFVHKLKMGHACGDPFIVHEGFSGGCSTMTETTLQH
jgi:hypothetical protein